MYSFFEKVDGRSLPQIPGFFQKHTDFLILLPLRHYPIRILQCAYTE